MAVAVDVLRHYYLYVEVDRFSRAPLQNQLPRLNGNMIDHAPKTDGMSRTTVVDARAEYSPDIHAETSHVS